MQLDILNLEGLPVEIKGTSRDELPQFFKDMGLTNGAEIGTYRGEFCEKFCRMGMKMFSVDPYHSYFGAGRAFQDQHRQDTLFSIATRRLSKYRDCTMIRKASMDAVPWFKDESLDFVYIDGDHSFKHVAEDIYHWTWKVKKGGVVAGHDYKANEGGIEDKINQVGPVIDAYVKAFGIKTWYLIGDKDRASSWFFIR